jgi:subfamily B ATP-binding cassette protein MsbA
MLSLNFAKLFDMLRAFQKLWPYVKPIKGQVILMLILGFLFALIQAQLPLLAKTLVSAFEILGTQDPAAQSEFMKSLGDAKVPRFVPFIGNSTFTLPGVASLRSNTVMDLVVIISLILPIYFLMVGILRYTHFYLVKYIGERVISDIRLSLMSKFMELDVMYLGRQKTGAGGVLSRTLNDTIVLQNGLQYFGDLVREPVLGLMIFIMMLFINWQLTLCCLVFLPVFAAVIRYVSKSLRQIGHESQESLEEVTKTLKEGMDGVRVIQSFNLQEKIKSRFTQQVHNYLGTRKRIIKREELGSPVNEWFASILVCGICIFQADMIRTGQSDLGSFIGFLFAAGLMDKPVKKTQQAIIRIQQNIVALDRLQELLDSETQVEEPTHPKTFPESWESIDFKDVSFSYADQRVLENINLSIKRGEVVALVGESGSGKSTLAGLLQRFFDPDSGEIRIGQEKIHDFTTRDLRSQIGYVTQDVFLFDDTIENNIHFGDLKKDPSGVKRAAEMANATGFIEKTTDGFQSLVGDRGGRLSGGEKQRISIARAVFKDPPILILDEATSALDSASEKEVQKGIESLLKGRTALVIAHRLSTIINSDRIIVMKNGRIVEEGNHDSLLAQNGEYAQFYKLQYN